MLKKDQDKRIEKSCPCPVCGNCCCDYVEGLNKETCVNFESYGGCTCSPKNKDA